MKKPWTRSGPRLVVSALAVLPPSLHSSQGTDLPSSAPPLGVAARAMKAQMRRCIAFESFLIGGCRRTPGHAHMRSRGAAGVYGRRSFAVKAMGRQYGGEGSPTGWSRSEARASDADLLELQASAASDAASSPG